VAEGYGIKVVEISEYKTSTRCIKCGSENTVNTGRLFKCVECGLEANRDTVGVLNIGSRLGESINGVEWDEVGG
jgi:transposase